MSHVILQSEFEEYIFNALQAITQVHVHTQGAAAKAINTALTYRNWLIGAYIHEHELKGQDRAGYGERLMARLPEELRHLAVPTTDS